MVGGREQFRAKQLQGLVLWEWEVGVGVLAGQAVGEHYKFVESEAATGRWAQ